MNKYLLAVLLLFASAVRADVFTIQAPTGTISWLLANSPTPTSSVPPVDNWFEEAGVTMAINGYNGPVDTLIFYPAGAITSGGPIVSTIGLDGLLSEATNQFVTVDGTIWAGLSNAPTFIPGTFSGQMGFDGPQVTLSIVEPTTFDPPDPIVESDGTILYPPVWNTPEPSTLAMLVVALALIAIKFRRLLPQPSIAKR